VAGGPAEGKEQSISLQSPHPYAKYFSFLLSGTGSMDGRYEKCMKLAVKIKILNAPAGIFTKTKHKVYLSLQEIGSSD
jgi:hypothetical protein